MTKWFYSGARNPPGGLTPKEKEAILTDLLDHLQPGDEVGMGGCDGVDECVAALAFLQGHAVTNFRPATPRAHDRESVVVKGVAAATIQVPGDELARNLVGIAWADKVRAIPLTKFVCTPAGTIAVARGSGTNHAARHAQCAGKLDGWWALR